LPTCRLSGDNVWILTSQPGLSIGILQRERERERERER
jgi:hypothetical protein